MKTTQRILKVFIYLFCILSVKTGWAQNVGISATSSFTPDASAGLDISYNNKGLLVPRVALTATNAAGPITSPAISLLVYNTATAGTAPNNVVPGYYYWNGVAWTALSTGTQSANPAWSLIGNAGTTAGTNFIGTTDAVDFVFKTNNAERARFTSGGNFGVGSTSFNSTNPEKLLVDAGASSFNVISGKGNLNSYLQLNIQNSNAGTGASSDVVATADDGNESNYYVDMGINSSANTANIYGGIHDAYLYNAGGSGTGGNFYIGTSTAAKSLGFLTGGSTVATTSGGVTTMNNERMRIDGTTGNVGVGNITPTEKLDITGNLKFSGALMPNNNAGTTGYFLVSSGANAAPIWYNANAYINTAAWVLAGNAGTTPGTNFIGTTDAQDMVFKANNVERMRIVNGTSATTGTTGDITIGDANSGTLRSAKELVMRQDGDQYGQSTLRLRNRAGQNGAVFETTGGTANLVDFIFNTGAVASPISSNIRFETRSSNMKVTGNTTEWQFGQPDVVNGGPTLIVGASGNGSNSALRTGNFGIGTTNPATKLHVFGANPLTLSGVVTGTSTTADSLLTITSGLVRKLPISAFASPSNSWSTTGNAGTSYQTNFLGTTDNNGLHFRTNNVQRVVIDSLGNMGVGSANFNSSNPEKLLVDAGTTSSFNVINGKGNLNNYLQLNIQNINAGTAASSDVVATADNGSESINYVDMGINSSGNTSNYFGAANDAYLYNAGGTTNGGNFFIGTSTANKSLGFLTGGGAATNIRMVINGTGNVGIGTTAPGQKLDVNGNIYASGGSLYSKSSVVTDFGATNTGTVTPGLQLGGTGSGEGISSKRTTGTDQYGLDFYTASANRMAITQNGNVGIGTITPVSILEVNGSVGYPILVASTSTLTLSTSNYTVIIPSTLTTTITLPAASGSTKRIYVLVNQSTSATTISSYISFTGSAVTTIPGQTSITVQSDGTNWYRIQ